MGHLQYKHEVKPTASHLATSLANRYSSRLKTALHKVHRSNTKISKSILFSLMRFVPFWLSGPFHYSSLKRDCCKIVVYNFTCSKNSKNLAGLLWRVHSRIQFWFWVGCQDLTLWASRRPHPSQRALSCLRKSAIDQTPILTISLWHLL